MSISNQSDLSIFFDESGKGNQPNQLMGGLAIPNNIYHSKDFKSVHKLNDQHTFHWSSYDGDSKMRNGIINLFELASPMAVYANLIFIKYSQTKLKEMAFKNTAKLESGQKKAIDDTNFLEETIYTKIPERIMYGLLRFYGNIAGVTSTIYVERANEYIKLQLSEKLTSQLNMHSLYRGESFIVQDCIYRGKGEEIGVELTDLLLGIFRTVLENPERKGRGRTEKIKLILELYKRGILQPFLVKLKLFEWDGSKELRDSNIDVYLNMFLAKNYNEYSSLNILDNIN